MGNKPKKYEYHLDYDEDNSCISLLVMTDDFEALCPEDFAEALILLGEQIKEGYGSDLFLDDEVCH